MLEQGKYDAEITSHTIRMLGDKPAAMLQCRLDCGNDEYEEIAVPVWLTEKAAQIARATLKLCGMDVDRTDMQELIDNPTLLAGNRITVIVEDYNGKMRGQVMLNAVPKKSEIKRIQAAIRHAAQDGEIEPSAGALADPDDIPF